MASIFDPRIFQNEAGSVGARLFQTVLPSAVTPQATTDAGGVGAAAWRDHYKPKREKEALEQRRRLQAAADMLQMELEVREREAKEAVRANQISEAAMRADFERAMLMGQLQYVQMILQEMDDEDAILLLSVH